MDSIKGLSRVFVVRDIEKIRKLVKSEKMPRGRDRCGYCEMRKFCKE